MTSREAAHTLLHSLYKLPSGRFIIVPEQNKSFLDALCSAVCALMREEEAGKGKHEAKINIPDEPPPWEEGETGWRDAITAPPKDAGCYYVKESADSEKIWYCLYDGKRWYPNYVNDADIKLWITLEDLKRVD